MAKTLLEIAKGVKLRGRRSHSFNEQELELVKAWINDEIGITQAQVALGSQSSSASYAFLAQGVRELIRQGRLRWVE